MVSALFRSLAQISDPRFRKVWLLGFVYSLLLFFAIVGLSTLALAQIELVGIGWIDTTIAALGSAATFVLALIFFPGLALMVITLLLEDVCRAVEGRHYPGLPAARKQGWGEIIGGSAKLLTLTVILNAIFLPVYVFLPVLNILVFLLVNGILLGREFYDLVSLRRLAPADATELRKRHRGRLFADGVLIAGLLAIPFIGWTMAVIAAAIMVHEFEALKK